MEKKKNQEMVISIKKQPNYRGEKAMPFVIGNETFEKLGTIVTSSNLLRYVGTNTNSSIFDTTSTSMWIGPKQHVMYWTFPGSTRILIFQIRPSNTRG
ncbi:hypothetical protein ACJIZ3_005271 [Penstemon smallii]|uniref:Uncharacterized protein n=1 Tax=Penstemon smallii TaxID=265156 RepID=A0ABD3S4E4_9LAMI